MWPAGHGLGSPDVEVYYVEIDNGLLLWRMMLQKPPKLPQSKGKNTEKII